MEEVLDLITKLYSTDSGGVGGYGHIVFDDGNLEDEHIEWCIEEAKKGEYKDLSEETRLASLKALEAILLLLLSERERDQVYHLYWNDLQ